MAVEAGFPQESADTLETDVTSVEESFSELAGMLLTQLRRDRAILAGFRGSGSRR